MNFAVEPVIKIPVLNPMDRDPIRHQRILELHLENVLAVDVRPVRVGGADGGSVLRVPVLPGSDLRAALTAVP